MEGLEILDISSYAWFCSLATTIQFCQVGQVGPWIFLLLSFSPKWLFNYVWFFKCFLSLLKEKYWITMTSQQQQ